MNLNDGAALHLTDVKAQMEWFQNEGLVPASLTIENLADPSFVETY